MIVFIAGMQRSGSTFSFNIARELLLRRGTVHQEAHSDILATLRTAGTADHVLIKAHTTDDLGIALARQGAMRLICTMRRPEDAAASWMETFGFSEANAIDQLREWFAMYRQIRHAALTVPYELIDRHPVRAAYHIARFLFPSASWREAWSTGRKYSKRQSRALVEQLRARQEGLVDIGFSQYDPKTFFHIRHVSSLESVPAEQRIGTEATTRIREALSDITEEVALYRPGPK